MARTSRQASDEEVQIVALTEALADEVREEGERALVGDASCSVSNMKESCFACEQCRRGGTPRMRVHDFLLYPIRYVAVRCGGGGDRRAFVGCVTAGPMGGDLASLAGRDDGFLLSNLCVSGRERKGGTGRRLVQAVRDAIVRYRGGAARSALYLCVACSSDEEAPNIDGVFSSRVPRLLDYYRGQGFHVVASTPMYHLLSDGGVLR